MSPLLRTPPLAKIFLAAVALSGACAQKAPSDRVRVSGQVEATEVQISSQVAGRILELRVAEGDRVARGDLVARLDTADAELAVARRRPSAITPTRSFACCRRARAPRTSARPKRRLLPRRPRPRPATPISRRQRPTSSASKSRRGRRETRSPTARPRSSPLREHVRGAGPYEMPRVLRLGVAPSSSVAGSED
jgi:pyruvate/2-oxoglutarate dehydrogenase complex dihydrolipoamide acyltransferase (E2) component